MLQEPQLSPYDWQFNLFGFPVRVAWGFWILALVLGWQYVQAVDYQYADSSPGAAGLLALWTGSLLVSILVHELGHALLHRYYGMDSRIVLYHFGGLAIPGSFTAWNAARKRFHLRPIDQILISAAGPLAQLILASLVWGIAIAAQVELPWTRWLRHFVSLPEGHWPQSASVYVLTDALVTQSIYWALLNMLPILPLDGGHVMRETLRMFGVEDVWRRAALVSMIAAGALGYYMFQHGQQGAGLMCLSFVASNYQLFQSGGYGRF